MTVSDDLARTILSATRPRQMFPPAGLAEGQIVAAAFLAPSTGEVRVVGVTDDVLAVPLENCGAGLAALVAADPAAMIGRRVLVLMGAQRAYIVDALGA